MTAGAKFSIASSVIVGTRSSRKEDVTVDDIEDLSEAESAELGEYLPETSKSSELEVIVKDISQTIDCLYRVSVHLGQRSAGQRGAKVAKVDVSLYEDYDMEFLLEKYPSLPNFLLTRIAKAISRRRQYVLYRQLHARKLRSEFDEDQENETRSILTQTTATTFQSSRSLGGRSTPTWSDYAPSITSETTYASLAANAGQLSMPDIPEDAQSGAPFECPTCRKIVQLDEDKLTQDWHRHIFRDLRPYICTFQDCGTPNTDYESRHQWFNHETKIHRVSWICHGHCNDIFQSRETFHEHLLKSANIDATQLSTFTDMCLVPMRDSTRSQCPFCQDILLGAKAIEKHVGHHLEEIALFALPRSMFNDYDDENSGLEPSNEPANEDSHVEAIDTNESTTDEVRYDEIVEDLRRSVEDWKGQDLASFGELLRHGTYTVSKGSANGQIRKTYAVFLFRRIILFFKTINPKKPLFQARKNEETKLQLKGRIFLVNINDLKVEDLAYAGVDSRTSYELKMSWIGYQGEDSLVMYFSERPTRNAWYFAILEGRGAARRAQSGNLILHDDESSEQLRPVLGGLSANLQLHAREDFEHPRPAPIAPTYPRAPTFPRASSSDRPLR